MLFPHKLKIKAIYHHIDISDNINELLYAHKKLIKIKKYLNKTKKISQNINVFNIKKNLYQESKKNNSVICIKKEIKKEIKTLLMSTIAHEMDPTQRAGQTITSNIRGAKKFGRDNKARKKTSHTHKSKSMFLKLLNFLFHLIVPMPSCILNANLVIQNSITNSSQYITHNNNYKKFKTAYKIQKHTEQCVTNKLQLQL
ncbi:hypothetical protein ECHHL_0588 [Ehrlichia chaffeensis str. Heartland]|uniref:Uncharacterized protein n=1 Tax=Ehrlichia chaffeensis (strain ATCC CRL-10679 / Arkansas) TaxID=205920 RepID=Q2GGG1_EHRCR|nr:hypothetical protein [Ehrlichia chaffeensis]ABD45473.1 hypothetical protein ECH_0664 [Ehrlichia chaffeensis str. Arkansas]AHX03743.1 hypothetical protein ECHHL_0588 [Ehrlichia chaffeensis str. Heartland]AHX05536.1 hypothetical protein ECHJAX_0469 [Ehrlichia chaffeensis str. Jax]AHX06526.1 hypothetical protein ECHLIB_0470 [Ehrlichia chaffeensis str. Liberty]AHX07566.1 hypothetical protein ECHOSC_0597 [Ehrlichia chaffeensis str. Osceola]